MFTIYNIFIIFTLFSALYCKSDTTISLGMNKVIINTKNHGLLQMHFLENGAYLTSKYLTCTSQHMPPPPFPTENPAAQISEIINS